MLTVLKWIFYLIATVALVVVGGSFFLPAEANVKRSIDIAAPPDKVFAIVGDLRHFNEFSPWADLDPNITYNFTGPESGIGQTMSWTSANADVGSGSQTIVAYDPPRHVAMELDFGAMGKSLASWDLVPSPAGTTATWGFRSDLEGIPAKWFGLMFDRWIGPDYEKGLSRLKAATGPRATNDVENAAARIQSARMPETRQRRSNRDRTEATRGDLILAARRLFTEKSYAETSTPEIAAAAGVTRGALYHHFADKQALFHAVVESEAEIVADEIERAARPTSSPREALIAGADAYLEAMRAPGRTRLLLLDGPAVLGRAAIDAIDARHGNRTLRHGLVAAMGGGVLTKLPPDALTALLGAMFDRAALATSEGASATELREVMIAVIDGLADKP